MKTIALVGSPNCGKTTLFNAVTGLHQHVGNWPGVTVERKEGETLEKGLRWVDLPGTYALSPYSAEERVTVDYLRQGAYDGILQIVDATAIARGLYLTHQLMQLQRPMVLALNMMDECRKNGLSFDCEGLEKALGVPVCLLTARTGEGIDELLSCVQEKLRVPPMPRETTAIHQAIAALPETMTSFEAWKCLEGDDYPVKAEMVQAARAVLEAQCGMDAPSAIACERYAWADDMAKRFVRESGQRASLTDALDALVLHPLLSLPILLLLLSGMLAVAFGAPGRALSALLSAGVEQAQMLVDRALAGMQVALVLRRLIGEGLMMGVGSVVSFLPMLLLLFLFLAVLEDSGYMARAAFLMDRPMRAWGLSGQAFIPLLLGFGCTVPAALSVQTMRQERDRRFTLMLLPMMSCSAKLPVYAALAAHLGRGAGVMLAVCIAGVVLAGIVSQGLRRTRFPGEAAAFVMELPTYRLPTLGSVVRRMLRHTRAFLTRACSVILLSSVVVWVMGRFTWSGQWAGSTSQSILGSIAGGIAPLLAPLGFGTPEMTAALLSGLLAKESIISTLAVLSGHGQLHAALAACLPTRAATMALMVFVLLYPPCAAATAAMQKEMHSKRMMAGTILRQWLLAWCGAWVVYRLALL